MEEVIDLASNFEYTLKKNPKFLQHLVPLFSSQIKSEILELLKLIVKIRPKIIIEIGTCYGGTLFLLSRFSRSNSILISIDLPGGIHGGGYPSYKNLFYKKFIKRRQKIFLIREDSHKVSTLNQVKTILKDKKVNILFIDGDHRYEGVKKDFEMFSPLVCSGGLICFHDIVHGHENVVGGVPIFWEEIKSNYNSQEIVEDWNQGGYGIGFIFI